MLANQRGFTLLEILVVMGVAGVLAAVALPGMLAALERNRVITGTDLLASQLRQARLAAITRNTAFVVRFDCPATGAVRVLAWTGNAAVDDAGNRCSLNQPNDGSPVYLPTGVTVNDGAPAAIRVNARGLYSIQDGGPLPLNLSVSYGSISRTLVITEAGHVRTPTS